MLDVPLGLNYRGPSPHGEGGLKYVANHNLPHIQRVSLPTRGGWSEMSIRDMVDKVLTSLPTRGGWIEIQLPAVTLCRVASPSPHGEGGLKCRQRLGGVSKTSVPPHTGRVD